MSLTLRIILIAFSILAFLFVIRKLRKAQFVVSDTLFWLLFSLLLLIFGIFPVVPIFFANLIGFAAPANFVYVTIIFLLIIKLFLMSVKLSVLENKVTRIAQRFALDNREKPEEK